MTAVQTMKKELTQIQQAMEECVTEYGTIKPQHRYRYLLLIQKARSFKESIDWMKEMREVTND